MSDLAIDVKNVTKIYGDGVVTFKALSGVDLTVKQGEFVYLVGPSGSGKTTLLSILGCVLRPTEGEVRLFGEEITKRRESELPLLRLAYVGFIFQGHNMIASLTAAQNVALLLELRGWRRKPALDEAVRLLDRVGIGDQAHKIPGDMSGGQKQRVSVARALAGNPPLILADEPTASLDAQNGLLVTELLKRLAREDGRTVLVVTHDNRIFHLADRIVNIEDGLIVAAPKGALS